MEQYLLQQLTRIEKKGAIRYVCIVLWCFLVTPLIAQNEINVKGKVLDPSSQPLPGVSILLKGKTTGTTTDAAGEYSIKANSSNDILVFSYIGYTTQEIKVGSRSLIDVSLVDEIGTLDEVVVTALGISREKKTLGYATQVVKGEQLNDAPATNFVNNLSGKVAGVQINSSGTVGGSARIVIRGESSLSITGNQPLYIIDGVPIGNEGTNNNWSGADYGNAAAEINPADIESMNVLKGPAAAALYGSRAANGAIVITTKSGKGKKGIGVSFNSYAYGEQVGRLPKFQNMFGQGRNGDFQGSNFGAAWSVYPSGIQDGYDESWGPRLDQGTMEAQYNSPTTNGFRGGDVALNNRGDIIETPWVSHPNNIKDFFDNGRKFYNNLAFSGSNDRGDYRLSFTSLNVKGVVPNNDLDRYQLNFNSSYKLTNKLSTSVNINYMKQKSENRPDNGYGRNTIMYFFTWMGRQVDINGLRDYWQPGFEGIRQFQYNYGENHNNPFFMLYENTKGQDKDRIFGNVALDYAFTDKLKLKLRSAQDVAHDFRPMRWAQSTVDHPNGRYEEVRMFTTERNTDFLLTYDNTTTESDFGYLLSAGGNRFDYSGNSQNGVAPQLLIPGVYNLGNVSGAPQAWSSLSKKRINSLYAMANLNYKGLVYLDITARNDWSSTLPLSNNSYFYPSFGLNTNLKDIFGLQGNISQLQLRASWAQVGNDAGMYQIRNAYSYNIPWGSNYSLVGNSSLANPDLKPEIVSTYEIGTAIGFFHNRLGLDVTYYDIRARNQILSLAMVQSSGASSRMINAGEIKNTGVEVVLNATPIATQSGFRWNMTLNWAHNLGKVIALSDQVDKLVQAAPGENASIQARVGERMGAIWGPGFQRVPDGPMKGEVIIFTNGRAARTVEDIYLGNHNPNWTGGWSNQVSYKGIILNFLFSGQYGGKFVSRFYNKAAGAGMLEESLWGRGARQPGQEYKDLYYAKGAALMADGSYQQNSTIDDGTLSQGIHGTDVRSMVKGQMDGISEAQLFSSTYFKLRELSLGYSLPTKFLKTNLISSAKIALTGRNLLLLTPKSNRHFDPEVSVATAGGGLIPGFENMSIPGTREFGISLNIGL